MSIFATKPIDQLRAEADATGAHTMKRVLGPLDLVTLGIGAIIGTGIFVLTGQAAAAHAGPAIVLSMVLAGVAAALAGLCYAEFASTVPIAGSAYTYGYATLGEFVAWIIGWDLILEYALGAATVAVGWSGYLIRVSDRSRHSVPGAVQRGARHPRDARRRQRRDRRFQSARGHHHGARHRAPRDRYPGVRAGQCRHRHHQDAGRAPRHHRGTAIHRYRRSGPRSFRPTRGSSVSTDGAVCSAAPA